MTDSPLQTKLEIADLKATLEDLGPDARAVGYRRAQRHGPFVDDLHAEERAEFWRYALEAAHGYIDLCNDLSKQE